MSERDMLTVPGPSEELFQKVETGRASQVIIDQIRSLIRQGRLRAGDRLPSERELCDRFGVSRVTVREALRVLEAGGLVTVRVGAHGGASVTMPSNERVGESFADLLTLGAMTASDITEARTVLEIGILPLVVERADAGDIAELREICMRQRNAPDGNGYSMDLSAEFHIRVAACTHNPAIETLVRTFHGPLLMSLREAKMASPTMGRRGAKEHADLVNAIESRDVDAATRIVMRHLKRTAEVVRKTGGRLSSQRAAGGSAGSSRSSRS